MAQQLGDEFDISYAQAHRLTSLVRQFSSHPDYKHLSGESGSEQWREQKRLIFDKLPDTLRGQPGNTVEERWNSLMDELEYQKQAEKGVYLKPWTEETDEKMDSLALNPDRELPGLHQRE